MSEFFESSLQLNTDLKKEKSFLKGHQEEVFIAFKGLEIVLKQFSMIWRSLGNFACIKCRAHRLNRGLMAR